MTNVLIIGGSRYLGKTIAQAFLEKGNYNVFTMNRGTRDLTIEGVKDSFKCDKTNREEFAKVLTAKPWDVIVDTILDYTDLEFVVETLGTNIGHFIHTGSIGVYGDARKIPAPEWLPLTESDSKEERIFNYKIKQDQVLFRAWMEKRFPMSILRMSYVYGAGDIPLDGWGGRDPEFFRMIARGDVIALPENGRALLQPGHVKDLGRAFQLCAERPETIGEVYNIGGDWTLMLKDYVRLIAKISGKKVEFEYLSREELLKRRPQLSVLGLDFVCQHMCSDINKAARDLSWRPEIPLEAGLRDNLDWLRATGKL